jgi:chitin disaccharide deacetylase
MGDFPRRPDGDSANPDEVLREWRGQIEAARQFLGRPPSHLDSHHGIHRHPNCVQAVSTLAKEYGLPVRGGKQPFDEAREAAGIKGSNKVVYDWTGRSLGAEDLEQKLLALIPQTGLGELVEVVTHPGYPDEYLATISAINVQRLADKDALMHLNRQRWLERNGFALTGFR